MAFLYVCLGAGLGAPARYLLDRAIQSRRDAVMPWGTVIVNVVGSLVLGVVAGVSAHHQVPPAVVWSIGTGLCGALTTYSTFSYETLRLYEAGAWLYAVANVTSNVVGAVAAAWLGYAVGSCF
jgi:CrcB protein